MPIDSNSNDYSPLFWYKRQAVYLTAFICAGLVAGMLITTILESANINPFMLLGFWREAFLHGWVWQLATYPAVDEPNFFFLFNVLFFFFAGNEVEKYLGRRRFLTLLGLMWAVPPLFICVWQSPNLPPFFHGSDAFAAALIIAFATLYPNLEYWGWVPMKYIAAGCLFLSSLSFLPRHNWEGLMILWGMCAVSFGYVRWLQLGAQLPHGIGGFFKRKPRFKVVQGESSAQETLHESIDPLLDKIAKSGLTSLTAKEIAQLEQARKSLLKKKQE